MKINRLETHDRFQHFQSQNFQIGECCQNLIDQRPFGDVPFYIFAHQRTEDDGINKRMLWQPRLTKPRAQTNSMLFKAYPGSDTIKIIWMIPSREIWPNFDKDKMMGNQTIAESIYDFQHNRAKLEEKEADDLSDEKIDAIYREIARTAKMIRQLKKQKDLILP